jgi:hypothetical protein
VDWGTRRKPIGAIVAWSSLAIFAVLSILGIAGVVMSLQPKPLATQVEVAEAVAEPVAPVEERLPGELTFAEAEVSATAEPEVVAVAASDEMIASTFEQLVEPVLVQADQVPAGAVAVATAEVELPMPRDQATLAPLPVSRNAAAWAIETEASRRWAMRRGRKTMPFGWETALSTCVLARRRPTSGCSRLPRAPRSK